MRHLLTLAVLQSALQCASHSPIHSHTIGGRAAIQASGLPSGVLVTWSSWKCLGWTLRLEDNLIKLQTALGSLIVFLQ